MGQFKLPGIASTDRTTTVFDQRELVFDTNNNQVYLGDGTAAGGLPLMTNFNFSAGTLSNNLSNLVFSNSNGVSFGLSGSTVTASVAGGAADGLNRIAAGTQTAGTLATVVFSNSNGITFGMSNNSIVTASHNGITSQSNPNISIYGFGNTYDNSSALVNASNFYFNGSGAAYVAATNGSLAVSVANSIGLNTAQSNVTWTVNSSGVSLDARGYAGSGTTATGGARITLNSNGIQFDGSALAGTNTTFNGANISGSMTINTAGVNLSMSVAAPGGGGFTNVNVSAGTTSQNLSNFVFSNSNNVSFGLNGSTITASANIDTLSYFEPFPRVTGSGASSHNTNYYFNHFVLPAPVAMSGIQVSKSMSGVIPTLSTANSSCTITQALYHEIRLFSRSNYSNNSSEIVSFALATWGLTATLSQSSSSASYQMQWVTDTLGGVSGFSNSQSTNTSWASALTGYKMIRIPIITTLEPGEYWAVHRISTAATTGGNSSQTGLLNASNFYLSSQGSLTFGRLGAGSATSTQPYLGGIHGVATGTSGTMSLSVISTATQHAFYINMYNGLW